MFRFSNAVLALALCVAVPALAEDRVTLGWGRMFSNDALGDAKDRWRTGGYQVSRVRGYDWHGALPQTPGELLEFRAAAQIVAPEDLVSPPLTDRRYATLLSFGMHTQFDWRGNDVSLGADVVVTGPQTGISNFQAWVHNMLNLPKPRVVDTQIGDGVYPTLVAELGRRLPLGDRVTLRPFVEAQVGVQARHADVDTGLEDVTQEEDAAIGSTAGDGWPATVAGRIRMSVVALSSAAS